MTTFFNYSEQNFQTLTVGDNLLVLSSLDSFTVGDTAGTSLNLSDSKTPNLYIYCDGIELTSPLQASLVQLGCNQITIQNGAIISANGAPGKSGGPTIPEQHGKQVKANNGQPGDPAGNVNLALTGFQDDSYATGVSAIGGDGGSGQSTIGGTGGDGGKGGEGGQINTIYRLQAPVTLAAITTLEKPYSVESIQTLINLTNTSSYPNLSSESQQLSSLLSSALSSLATENQALNKLNLELKSAQGSDKSKIENEIVNLDLQIAKTNANLQSGVNKVVSTVTQLLTSTNKVWPANVLAPLLDVSGGNGGTFGTGKTNGSNGIDGAPGAVSEQPFQVADYNTSNYNFVPVHPVQCSMALTQLELAYYVQTFNNSGSSSTLDGPTLQSSLTQLINRTEFANSISSDSPLAKQYADSNTQSTLGFIDGLSSLQTSNNRAKALLAQLNLGLDYYGNQTNAVPLLSFDFLSTFYDGFFDTFSNIEKTYNTYFKAELSKQETTASIESNLNSAKNLQTTAQDQINEILATTTRIAANIVALDQQFAASKQTLDEAINKVIDDIQKKFNYDWFNIQDALSLVSTFSDSALDDINSLIDGVHDGLDTISTQAGDKVDKSLVINKIQTIKSSIDSLKTGYTILGSGEISLTGNGVKLLATDESSLLNLLKQYFSPNFKDYQAVETAFNNYINIVVKRNNAIAYYNSQIMQYIKYSKLVDKYQGITSTLSTSLLQALSPDFPALVQFMSEVYVNARSVILELLYQMQRAYEFYAVVIDTTLPSNLTNPPEIDATAISAFEGILQQKYKNAVNARGTDPEQLIDNQVSLSAGELSTLTSTGQVTVNIPIDTAIFQDKADIRLNQVEFYIKGIQPAATGQTSSDTADIINIKLVQSGNELIVPTTGPSSVSFVHEPISVLFQYNVVNGDIKDNGQIGSSGGKYTGIGPFSDWTITITNPGNFDFKDVTSAYFSFYGTNLTRTS